MVKQEKKIEKCETHDPVRWDTEPRVLYFQENTREEISMKIRWFSGFLAACMLLTFTPISKVASQSNFLERVQIGDIVVNEETFPDLTFRNWILDGKNINGAGADGILTEEELASITQIDVSMHGIQNLKGIEIFSALKELNCSNNQLNELDVSHNTELERLYCSYNNLQQLSLENNTNLISLSISFNRISSLDVSNKPQLKTLNSQMSSMTQLNLSGSTALEWINVANNALTDLDLSTNVELQYVNLFDNRLTSLNVDTLSKLDFLNVGSNQLTKLDLSQNKSLSAYGGFFATDNYLEELTLPDQENVTIESDRYAEQTPITGYENVAWYLDEGFTQPVTGDLSAEGQTIYAKRIANSYQIYFSSNYGNGEMSPVSASYDTELSLPAVTFSRYGHTFYQWDTLPQGGGNVYSDQETVRNLSGKWDGARITLYAQWKPNQYQIVFDANDGSAAGQMDGIDATYGSSVQLSANAFELADKEFAGWAIEPDGPVRFRDSATVQNLSAQAGATVTLYAVWRTPIAEVQSPYLEKLEQKFQSYSSEDYTGEDWTQLSEAYATGNDLIRNSDVAEDMERYSNQAIEKMDLIQDREARIQEILDQWEAAHSDALEALQTTLVESNAAQQAERAQAALEDLENERLARYCGLTEAEDIEQIVGEAKSRLQETSTRLTTVVDAAQWLLQLNGMSVQPLEQVSSKSAALYRMKLEEYDALTSEQQSQIHSQIREEIEKRKELAERKKGAISELQTYYRSFSSEDSTIQEALLRELEQGVANIEKAGSNEAVQTALQQGQTALDGAAIPTPTSTPTPTQIPKPPAGGGGGAVSTYAVTIQTSEYGGITANLSKAAQGVTVILQVTPDAGYELAGLTVTDSKGNKIPVQNDGDGRYTFTMPASKVEVRAEFAWSNIFTDVNQDGWYYDAIAHGVKTGMFKGVGDTQFMPEQYMTRAMLATVLYRAAGEPSVETKGQMFDDVDPESWYGAAVYWAQQAGVTSGVEDGRFGPDEHITREQLVTMLHRFIDTPEANGSLEGFVDADQADAYAGHALQWAVGQGVINGMGDGTLAPKGMATRAQVAQIMMKFMEQIEQK